MRRDRGPAGSVLEHLKREARGVPDLRREGAVPRNACLAERQVAAGARKHGEREPHRVRAELVAHLERVDDVALRLRHLLALLVADEAVQDDVGEGRAAVEGRSRHDHPGDPEEQDIEPRDEDARRVEALEVRGLLRPAENRERHEPGREPGVEDVGVAHEVSRGARRARSRIARTRLRHGDMAVRTVPGGNLVAPPELPRDAPVADIPHPLVVGLLPELGHEARLARVRRGDRPRCEGRCLHEPLERDERLDDRVAPLAARERDDVALFAAAAAFGVEVAQDLFPRLEAVEAGVRSARGRGHLSVEANHDDRLEPIPLSRFEVVRIVRGRDLQDTRAELPIHEGVRYHRDGAARERQLHTLSSEPRVPLVVGMHSERGVSEHRLRARRGDDELARRPFQRVRDRVEMTRALDVVDLEIRKHRGTARAPVHHPLGAVGETFVVERREDVPHRLRARLVERVVDAREIARRAETPDLVQDVAAPRPGPFAAEREEGFASDVMAALPGALLEIPLDDHLRRDAGVVDAGHPEHRAALHPPPAAEHVFERAPESVPDVEPAGDVGRRDDDREGLCVLRGRLRAEEPRVLLRLVPAHLEGGGFEILSEHRRPARPDFLVGPFDFVEPLFHEALGELGHDVPRDPAHDALAGELEDAARDAVDVSVGEWTRRSRR